MLQDSAEILQETVPQEKSLSIYNLIMDGGLGGQIIIAILLVLLTVALYIYFERYFAIKAASKTDSNFMNQIRDYVSHGKLDSAKVLCAQANSPASRLIEKGISRIGKPLADINTGFLGTVIGMIIAIHQIANAGGQIDIKMLSDGLYTAMTTTVAGLIVGIIAYIQYNHLVVRTNKVVYEMEAHSVEFLDLLNEPV